MLSWRAELLHPRKTAILLAAASILPASPALSQSIRSSLIEQPTNVVIERSGFGTDAKAAFSAFGRKFRISLQGNDRIKAGLDAELMARVADVHLYRGRLDGVPESWVRLAERDGELSGVFWDGLDLYSVEITADAAQIYRVDEVLSGSGISLAGDSPTAPVIAASASSGSGSSSFSSSTTVPISPGRTIQIGLVADSHAVDNGGASTEADLLSIMNVVDGFFLWQLGVQIEIAEVVLLDAASDPFDATEIGQFLADMSAFKTGSTTLGPLGLVHLFTGRDMTDSASQSEPVGAATIGSVCDTQTSVGISEFDSSDGLAVESLVAAHEIGHNFGAPHDNETGSACAATPAGFLMDPFVNGSETFSQCSIDQMLPLIVGGSCLLDWLPNDLALRFINGPSVLDYQDEANLIVAIDTNGLTTGNVVELFVESSGAIELGPVTERFNSDIGFECDRFAYPRYCSTSYLPEGSSAEFEIEVHAAEIGSGDVTITVRGGNDPNPANDVIVHAITVPPAIDLESSLEVVPGQSLVDGDEVVYPETLIHLSASVENLSPDPATNATAEFRFDPLATDYQTSTPGGTCGPGLLPHWFVCDLGTLAGGERRAFDLSFRTSDSVPATGIGSSDYVTIKAEADEFDFVPQNDDETVAVLVVNSIYDVISDIVYPTSVEVGVPAAMVFSLENLGPDPMNSVSFQTTHFMTAEEAGLEFSVTTNLGDCELNQYTSQLTCEYGTLGVGERIETTIAFVGSEAVTFQMLSGWGAVGYKIGGWSGAGAFDLVIVDSSPPAPPPNPAPAPPPAPVSSRGGGGGGATGWLTLMLLALVSALVPVRRSSPNETLCP